MLCWPRARLPSWRIPMQTAKYISPIALVTVLVALLVAGCGGGSGSSLKSDDIAVVGDTHVTKKSFDTLLSQAKRSYAQQGRRSRSRARPSTRRSRARRSRCSSSRPSAPEKAEVGGHQGHRQPGRQAARPDQEAVLRRQREEVQGAAEEAAPHRRAGARRRALAARLRGDLQQGDKERQGLERRGARPTTSSTRSSTRRRRRATCGTSSSRTRAAPSRSTRS